MFKSNWSYAYSTSIIFFPSLLMSPENGMCLKSSDWPWRNKKCIYIPLYANTEKRFLLHQTIQWPFRMQIRTHSPEVCPVSLAHSESRVSKSPKITRIFNLSTALFFQLFSQTIKYWLHHHLHFLPPVTFLPSPLYPCSFWIPHPHPLQRRAGLPRISTLGITPQ